MKISKREGANHVLLRSTSHFSILLLLSVVLARKEEPIFFDNIDGLWLMTKLEEFAIQCVLEKLVPRYFQDKKLSCALDGDFVRAIGERKKNKNDSYDRNL